MQATIAPPTQAIAPLEEMVVALGPLPMGVIMPDPALLLLYAESDDELTPPIADLDEILAVRCASL